MIDLTPETSRETVFYADFCSGFRWAAVGGMRAINAPVFREQRLQAADTKSPRDAAGQHLGELTSCLLVIWEQSGSVTRQRQ